MRLGDFAYFPCMGRCAQFYAFWLDRSPLHGVPYKKVMTDANGSIIYSETKFYDWRAIDATTFFQYDVWLDTNLAEGYISQPFPMADSAWVDSVGDGHGYYRYFPDSLAICYRVLL